VFALLWEKQKPAQVTAPRVSARRKRRRREEESDEEQEEVETPARVVDPDAWGLVEWLVDLWKRDREDYATEHPGQRECQTPGEAMSPDSGRCVITSSSVQRLSHPCF